MELVRRVGTGGVVSGLGGVVIGRGGGGEPTLDVEEWLSRLDSREVGRVAAGTGGGRAILALSAAEEDVLLDEGSVFTVAGLARAGL